MADKEILIRPIRMGDAEEMEAFFDRLTGQGAYFFNPKDCNRIRIHTYFDGSIQNTEFFVAEDTDNGRIAGYVFLRDLHKTVAYLGIAVDEGYRNCKLGTRLLERIHEYARACSLGGILLHTHPANTQAQALYSKMGYERLGTHLSGEFLYIRRF